MKHLLLIVMLLISTTSFAGVDAIEIKTTEPVLETSQYVTESNAEKLIDKYSAKVDAAITSLAKSLKQPAEYVYKVLVRQQLVQGYINLFAFLLFFILGVTLIILEYKIPDTPWYDVTFFNAGGIILLVIAFIALLIFIFLGASQILNPEYHAIKEILEVFK